MEQSDDDNTGSAIGGSLDRQALRRLNLGCGSDRRDGYINSDILGGDVQVDLTKFPWPWPDNFADEIWMRHVLEHLPDTEATLGEIRRILKPGGRFVGQVPHCYSQLAFAHWQHHRYFHHRAFDQMAGDFDFELVKAAPGVHSVTKLHRLRNLIPFRKVLGQLILNVGRGGLRVAQAG